MRCHGKDNPGIIHDWENSVHAKVGVDCYKCHRTDKSKTLFNRAHLKNDPNPIAIVVTPRVCGGCHPKEVAQYNKSKQFLLSNKIKARGNLKGILDRVEKQLDKNHNERLVARDKIMKMIKNKSDDMKEATKKFMKK